MLGDRAGQAKNRPPMYSEGWRFGPRCVFFVFVFCLGGGFKPEKKWSERKEGKSVGLKVSWQGAHGNVRK